MKIREVRLQNFRNFDFFGHAFGGDRQFVVGRNGQGKSNLLEGIHLLASCRSFRGTDTRGLVRWEAPDSPAAAWFRLRHELHGDCTVEIRLEGGARKVWIEEEPIGRLEDFIGQFPTVCFHSQDIQLMRAGPNLRRRFMDMILSASDRSYLLALADYHKLLKERNAGLKAEVSAATLAAFEPALIRRGWELVSARRNFVNQFQEEVRKAYEWICAGQESIQLAYEPTLSGEDLAGYTWAFQSRREADLRAKSTRAGPHRDDWVVRIFERDARQVASEGQQRGIVLALRLAEVHWLELKRGIRPVLLADDILGELDPVRRKGFWKSIGSGYQIIATGTHLPPGVEPPEWSIEEMESGKLRRE